MVRFDLSLQPAVGEKINSVMMEKWKAYLVGKPHHLYDWCSHRVRFSVVVLAVMRTPAGTRQVALPFLTSASPLEGRNVLTRGTSVVIDIHNTSLARPLQIEYPAVLRKTVCF